MGYFKPWRRKIGVVALLTACVFAAGWLRSRFVADAIGVYGYFGPLLSFHSEWGTIQILRWDGEIFKGQVWTTQPAYQREFNPWISTSGILTMSGNSVIAEGWGYSIPYWLVVIPLTLLSAWLLLSKIRDPKPQTEPTPSKA